MNRERFSEITSSLRVGRCAISTAEPLSSRGNPLFDFLLGAKKLLAVELDYELFLNLGIDN